jgi:hypothetical protein
MWSPIGDEGSCHSPLSPELPDSATSAGFTLITEIMQFAEVLFSWFPLFLLKVSYGEDMYHRVQVSFCPETEFLDVTGTKVLRVFLLAFYSHFYYRILLTPLSKSGLKLICNVDILYGNLQSENSQDYAQRPQRNCKNSASGLDGFHEVEYS